jgi:hypothetical protein
MALLSSCGQAGQNNTGNGQTMNTANMNTMDNLSDNTVIMGSWKINQLITGHEAPARFLEKFDYEYELVKPDKDNPWGNNVEFKSDKTFTSYYSAWCGNDIFTTTYGTYQFADKHHVRLTLKRITVTGMAHSDTQMEKDLGLFYVYKDTACIKLIPSNGDPSADAQKIKYSSLIDAFDYETREVPNFMFIPGIPIKAKDIPGIVTEYFQAKNGAASSFKSQDLNILYAKIIRTDKIVILLEEKQTKQHHFLVCFPYSKTAGLYNPAAFRKYLKRRGDHG